MNRVKNDTKCFEIPAFYYLGNMTLGNLFLYYTNRFTMCSVSTLLQELTKLILGMKRKRGRYFECRLVQGPNIMSLGDLNWWLFCHITHFNNNMQEMNKKRLIKAFEYLLLMYIQNLSGMKKSTLCVCGGQTKKAGAHKVSV